MDIHLNFINRSTDTNNSQIVIFQKNAALGSDETAVAWQVIKNCAPGDNHPLVYPFALTVGASDSWGNYTPLLAAETGQMFAMTNTGEGDVLGYAGPSSSPTEVQVLNGLKEGAITASIYKAGKLLATKTSLLPQQKATFQFRPTLWITVVSQLDEGQLLASDIMSGTNTELSLLGLASADIVMTGGGHGISAVPYQFSLTNVVMA